MITLNNYPAHDGHGLAKHIARKALQPAELVAAALEAVEQVAPKLRGPMRRITIGITIVIGLVALCVPADAQS